MWATFARTNPPGAPGQPAWPSYTLAGRGTMVIDARCRVVKDPDREERLFRERACPSCCRIRDSGYLRSLQSFAGVCKTRRASLCIFGRSFDANHDRVLNKIGNGHVSIYVSFRQRCLTHRAGHGEGARAAQSERSVFPCQLGDVDLGGSGPLSWLKADW